MRNPDFWARTHQGRSRDKNEDAFSWLGPESTGQQGYLWLVCDGMGGEAAGELASSVVAQLVADSYPRLLRTLGNPHAALTEALGAANRRLLYMQEQNSDLTKMGSTLVGLALYEDQLWIASVGDSRVYAWEGGRISERTTDHTKYEKMMELGVLKPADARPDHPARSVLLNVLGRGEMYVDTLNARRFPAHQSCWLLCSDGLYSFVSNEELSAAFRCLDAKDATRLLLSAALPRSTDNITLQIVRFAPPQEPRSIEEVAAELGIELMDEVGRSLPTSSYHFSTTEGWGAHRTGRRAIVGASAEALAVPLQAEPVVVPPPAKGTVLFSPEDLRTPLLEAEEPERSGTTLPLTVTSSDRAKQRSSSNVASAPATEKPQDQQASAGSAPEVVAASTTFAAAASPASALATSDPREEARGSAEPLEASVTKPRREARRHLTTGGPTAEPLSVEDTDGNHKVTPSLPVRRLALAGVGCLLLAGVVAILWKPSAPERTSSALEVEPVPSALNSPPQSASVVRSLPSFEFPHAPRFPDRVHEADAMPAFLVADGKFWLDAHEVTAKQYAQVAGQSYGLKGLSERIDAPRFAQLPCVAGVSHDKAREREPVCASPESAEAYCQAVGRELPSAELWTEVTGGESALVARGYGRIFEWASDGAPPVVSEPVSGIFGVMDGLPEVLRPNPAQRQYGDLVLLAPHDGGVIRVERDGKNRLDAAAGGAVEQMMGFRCALQASSEDTVLPTENDAAVAAEPLDPAVNASSSRRAQGPSRTGRPSADEPRAVEDAARSSAVAPRSAPSNEAPMDPNVSDDSLILQRLRERGAQVTGE